MRRIAALSLAALLWLAGCSDEADKTSTRPSAAGAIDLSGVCPETIVVQGSWEPGITESDLYSLLGPDPDVDAGGKRVTAPLVAQGKDTGVKLEVRAGGPAIGFTQTSAQMYLDRDIMLGRIQGFDEVIRLSTKQPTLAVLAPLEIDAQIIFWDPETHPDFESIRDIGQTDTTVVYVEGDTYMEYLIGAGILKRGQLDSGYDLARFVVERGKVAQSGVATHVPYIYEHAFDEWGKPVKYELVYDSGYPNYGGALVIRPDAKEQLAPCLRKLVPIIQQAQVSAMADPDATIALIARLSDAYKNTTPTTIESEIAAVRQMRELNIVGNGEDTTIGNFDEARIQRLIDITRPIFAAQDSAIEDGLAPSDVVTNEFVDPDIGFERE